MLRSQNYKKTPTTTQSLIKGEQEPSNSLKTFGSASLQVDLMPIEEQIQQLIASHTLKDEALKKSSLMVSLMEEERQELKREISSLRTELDNKNQQIQHLKRNIKTLSEQLKDSQQTQTLFNTPNPKLEAITGSKLIFSFSNPTNSSPKASMQRYTPHTLQIRPQLQISQQMSPWRGPQGVLCNLVEVLSKQESNLMSLEQVEEVVAEERVQSELVSSHFKQIMSRIEDDIQYDISDSLQDSRFKIYTDSTQKDEDPPISELFNGYETIIQNYRSYSAHLKANLCQTLNCLHQISQLLSSLPSKHPNLRNCLARTVTTLTSMLCPLKEQNSELHLIVQGMIQNWRYLNDPQT